MKINDSGTYTIKLGTSFTEVIVPPGLPTPDPAQALDLWIGKQEKTGELPPARITINGKTYSAKLVRDHGLDES